MDPDAATFDFVRVPISENTRRDAGDNEDVMTAAVDSAADGDVGIDFDEIAGVFAHHARLSDKRVEHYIRALKAGEDLEPLVVATRVNAICLLDGEHRCEAARQAGKRTIDAYRLLENA